MSFVGVGGFSLREEFSDFHKEGYQEAVKVLLRRVESILYNAGKGGI